MYPAGEGLGGVWALKSGFAQDKIAVVDQVSACLLSAAFPRPLSLPVSVYLYHIQRMTNIYADAVLCV